MDASTFKKFRREVIRDDSRIDAYFPDIQTMTLFPHWRRKPEETIPERISSRNPEWQKIFEKKEPPSAHDGPALGLKWDINNGKARIVVVSCELDKVLAGAGPRRSFGRRRQADLHVPYI